MWPFSRKTFHYQNGPVETRTPWFRPSEAAFESWMQVFLQLTGIEHYDVWLCGGFLQQKWPTWDIDIVLTGPIEPVELEHILTEGLRSALVRRLLVDIQHQNQPPLLPLGLEEPKLITRTVLSPVIYKNGERVTDWTHEPSLRQLGPHLWQVSTVQPDQVQISRMRVGMTYDLAPVLIKKGKNS